MDDTYAELGTEVILGKHTYKEWHLPMRSTCSSNDRLNWSEGKERFVGQKTKITGIRGRDFSGCLCCSVVCDSGRFSWRVESMILASEEDLIRK
jgi:hypothetical protein